MVDLRVYAPETDGERQLVVEWESPTNAFGHAFTYSVQWTDSSGADTDMHGVANVSDDQGGQGFGHRGFGQGFGHARNARHETRFWAPETA